MAEQFRVLPALQRTQVQPPAPGGPQLPMTTAPGDHPTPPGIHGNLYCQGAQQKLTQAHTSTRKLVINLKGWFAPTTLV